VEPDFGPASYGDAFADVYDKWYTDVSDVGATVARLAELAGGGPALELGIGSGRIALPLAARGVVLHGIDASVAMVERLRAKPGGASLPVTIGDMAELELEDHEPFTLVFAAYNTFLNLATEADQRRCLARVATVLAPGGRLVIEAFVPNDDGPLRAVEASTVAVDHVVLTVTSRDPASQTVFGQHVELTDAGVRLRPWRIRYLSPAQLDALAADAGLTLVSRWSDWDGTPFVDGDAVHISLYGGR
jgi:SAM-dependent methyltransferase